MTYLVVKNRGVINKSIKFRKLTFHKKSSYNRVLAKCITEIYPNNQKPATCFFLANSEGHYICTDGKIAIEGEHGTEKSLSWSLELYLQVLHVRFPSKVKLYCVEKEEEVILHQSLCYLWLLLG